VVADHARRLSVESINRQFRDAGGSYEEYGAAVKSRLRARLGHDASLRRLPVVYARRGRLVRIVNVCFAAHYGLRLVIAPRPKSAACGPLRVTSQAWSMLPFVRPIDVVHMTTGHNALRGSGRGQTRVFDDAMAQIGLS
jgi:hypothetical protein